jgi:Calcineurin-like phosphoesterase
VSKFFNKYVVVFLILVLLFATGIKIHNGLTDPPGSGWNRRNLQRIDRSRSAFSFAVFGDNQNSIGVFNDLIEHVNREDVAFSLDNGDLVFDGERPKYRFFINQVKRLNKPLLTNIGNHDILGNGRGNYYDILGPFYYSFTVGSSYFIVVDDANEQGVDPWQKEWLAGELSKSRSYANRFVFIHVPLYDDRTSGFGLGHCIKNKKAARELRALFDRYDVTTVFASHIHGYYKGVWGKTPYIITGGAGGELAGTDPHHYFFHYVKVNVSDAGVSYDVVKLKTPATILERIVYSTWVYTYAFFAVHYLDLIVVLLGVYLLAALLYYFQRRRTKQTPDDLPGPSPPGGEA